MGICVDEYMFCGFSPRKEGEFKQKLEGLYKMSTLGIFFESPSRILKSLGILNTLYPKLACVVAKELTKLHEHVFRGTVESVFKDLQCVTIKGEWLFAVDFRQTDSKKPSLNTSFITMCQSMDLKTQDIIKLCVQIGMNKNQVYNYLHSKN